MQEGKDHTVDVVIPSRGRPDLLERALRSVLAQSRAPDRIIVIDDCSDVPLRSSIAKDLVDRCSFFRYTSGLGAGGARNAGIQHSHADWIAFVDADDWWFTGHLAGLIECAVRYKCRAIVGGYRAVFSNGLLITYRADRPPGVIANFADYMFKEGGLCRTSTFLVGRAEAELVGFDPEVRHEDWDFMLRIARDVPVGYNDAAEVGVDHDAGGRFSHTRDAAASFAFLAKHYDSLTRRQRNGFRLRVARSAAVRAQRAVTRALLRDLEAPVPLSSRLYGLVSLTLCVHPLVTRCARYCYLLITRLKRERREVVTM